MPLSKPDLGFHYGLGKESYVNNTGSRSKSMQHEYGELPMNHLTGLRLDIFCSTLGYMPIQRRLLAVPTPNLENAVRLENEFLQIKPGGEKKVNTSVR